MNEESAREPAAPVDVAALVREVEFWRRDHSRRVNEAKGR